MKIQDLNMQAIVSKNRNHPGNSFQGIYLCRDYRHYFFTHCIFISSLIFQAYVANPIVQLTQSIKSIAGKNYEERLHFDRKDEFEELAEAFNQMAEKLDEYEHSNLAEYSF